MVQCTFEGQNLNMGILVDEVLEVLNVTATQIEPPPDFGLGSVDTEFILGVGKAEERVIFLLDIDKVLTTTEASNLSTMAKG